MDINREVAAKFGLEIINLFPFRDGILISTNSGKKFLKKNSTASGRILFIHSVKEHLINSGFKNVDRYVCTPDGQPFLSHEGILYTVTDMVEGTECNFDSESELLRATRLLAEFHKHSKGYAIPDGCIPRNELGKLPQHFLKRLEEIRKLKKIAKRGKSKFDYLLLENIDYFYAIGEDALKKMSCGIYEELVDKALKEGTLCHHDFTHKNVIMGHESTSLINFEFCSIELKVYDLANLLRRKMRKCDWDIKKASLILNEYKKTEELSEKDIYLLRIMLQFPQKFWRVINKYYNSRRSWSERSYIIKLQEVIDEKNKHMEFLNKFDTM